MGDDLAAGARAAGALPAGLGGRRLALEAVIAAFACGVLFILFKIFGAELDQVEVAIIFAAGLGIKLVFYPVYGDGTEN